MKRAVITCLLAGVALSMTGCPIYPSDNLCHSRWDCAPGYTCDDVTGTCLAPAPSCTRPADCTGKSETCAPDGTCRIGSCHQFVDGCVAGYTCAKVNSTWTCVAGSGPAGIGGSTGAGGAASMGGAAGNSAEFGGSSATTGGSPSTGGLPGTGGSPAAGGST